MTERTAERFGKRKCERVIDGRPIVVLAEEGAHAGSAIIHRRFILDTRRER